MKKEDIVRQASLKTCVAKADCNAVLESVIDSIRESLIQGEPVFLRGFGTFNPVVTKEKVGRIIATGESVVIPEHITPKFKPSKEFIKSCNQ